MPHKLLTACLQRSETSTHLHYYFSQEEQATIIMAWPVRKRSDGGGGGGDVGDSSSAEPEMNALLAHHHDDSTNTNNNYSQTAPPISGNIPSPTSGIHTILNDGINRTILLPSDATVLRHRHHNNNSQSQQPANHQQQSHSSQPLQSSQSWDIYGRHSLDDADVAAGALSMISHHHHQQQQHARPPIVRGRSSSSSGVTRSLSNPKPSPMKSSLNSMGSKTPQSGRLQGVGDMIMHPFFSSPPNKCSNDGSLNNSISSYAQYSNQFFNNSTTPQQQQPPQPIQMERGIGSGRKNLNNAYYGGSEHDFLRLSAYDNETSSTSSSAAAQHQQQQYASQNQQYQQQYYYNSPQRIREMPSMPPLEITTNQQRSTSTSSSSSYPPYGLPSSIADETNNRRKNAHSAISDVQNYYSPSSRTSPSKLSLSSSTNNNRTTISSKFIVLGINLSSYNRQTQFLISASGTFMFSLLYGYLQELISVTLCHRQLGLFLALMQFSGYTILSYFFRNLGNDDGQSLSSSGSSGGRQQVVGLKKRAPSSGSSQHQANMSFSRRLRRWKNWVKLRGEQSSSSTSSSTRTTTVPLELYIGLSILRAIDLGMTNTAMQYVNYPTKTLMKSTRVIFTMLFGILFLKKRYGIQDYAIVGLMVAGLGMFMHADSKSSAVFQPLGIIMLTISLLCDGAISNLSEALMNQYEVGQDEFIFRLYSIATFFIFMAAAMKGDLRDGMAYLTTPGTLQEMNEGLDPTWSIFGKVLTMALFSTTGFLGSSCSAAITKTFGALTMSITSTARKATTIFLSFALFPNECTFEHVGGIFLFITSLIAKSLRASKRVNHHHHHHHDHRGHNKAILEAGDGSSNTTLYHSRCSKGENAV